MNIYDLIAGKKARKYKKFAVLIDPDKVDQKKLTHLVDVASKSCVDFFFVGGFQKTIAVFIG